MSQIIVPLDGDNTQESTICAIDACRHFAQIELDENSTIVEINFHSSYKPILGLCEYLVVDTKEQNFDDFDDQEMILLLCEPKSKIDDIVEGFMFRSLQEI